MMGMDFFLLFLCFLYFFLCAQAPVSFLPLQSNLAAAPWLDTGARMRAGDKGEVGSADADARWMDRGEPKFGHHEEARTTEVLII